MKSKKCQTDPLPSETSGEDEISFIEEIHEFIRCLSNFFKTVSDIYATRKLTLEQQKRVFAIQVDIARQSALFSQMLVLKSEDDINDNEEEISDQMDLISIKMNLFDMELDYLEPETIFQPEKYYGFKVAQSNISGMA